MSRWRKSGQMVGCSVGEGGPCGARAGEYRICCLRRSATRVVLRGVLVCGVAILLADEILGVQRPKWSVLRPFIVVPGLAAVQGCTKGVGGAAFRACKHS